MSSYSIGKQITITVTVADKPTGTIVDPSSFLFTLKPPVDGGYVASTYAWNGSSWTSSENVIAAPSRTGVGVFQLRITVPHVNIAQGAWAVDWKHVANGGGFGEGADFTTFVAMPSPALP